MPTKVQESFVIPGGALYSDSAADGPEIGTLVLVVDRAKNLPNLKTIGKQDPYCAARLGKEAKKTTTDIRGGQTPRWYVAAYSPRAPITTSNTHVTGTRSSDSLSTTPPITTSSSCLYSPTTRKAS